MLAALVLFLSAFLLFALQPLLGKLLLPLAGGAIAGWLSVLVFFQLVLLLGYYLAYRLNRSSMKGQAGLVMLALVAGVIVLPPHFAAARLLNTPLDILGQLARAALLPALALSLLSNTVQRLVAGRGRNPYPLYAASNAGSLLGLLSYPLVVEPLLPLSQQQNVWSALYAVLLVLVAALLRLEWADMPMPATATASWRQRLNWLVLAAIPASLSYGLVSYVTTDLGAFPLLWVVPLALYLLSFIIAFSPRAPAAGRVGMAAVAVSLLALTQLLWHAHKYYEGPDEWLLGLWGLVFFLLALALHLRLASLRPAPEGLGQYYVWLAVGGALGGLFNVFCAPLLFAYPAEFFFALLLALALIDWPRVLVRVARPLALVAAGGVLLVFCLVGIQTSNKIVRNFYGTMMVFDAPDEQGVMTRFLTTGTGLQGSEQLLPLAQRQTELYFKPLDAFFAHEEFKDVGMLGLGAGMALCFSSPQRHFTVYEIDPKVRAIAESDFTYIRDCGAPVWRMGDGRIEMQRDTPYKFDALLIDAFHGANVPLHLITREALDVYRRQLKPQGVLLYNTNSIYYRLAPQVVAQARAIGWQAWQAPVSWVLLAPPEVDLSWLRPLGWRVADDAPVRVWSDDHASLLEALIWR